MKGTFGTGFLCGLLVILVALAGCAAIEYRYYGLANVPDDCFQKATLLGKLSKAGWPDLSFSVCKPDAASKGKCVVELREDHFAKERLLQECAQQLSDCQAGPHP